MPEPEQERTWDKRLPVYDKNNPSDYIDVYNQLGCKILTDVDTRNSISSGMGRQDEHIRDLTGISEENQQPKGTLAEEAQLRCLARARLVDSMISHKFNQKDNQFFADKADAMRVVIAHDTLKFRQDTQKMEEAGQASEKALDALEKKFNSELARYLKLADLVRNKEELDEFFVGALSAREMQTEVRLNYDEDNKTLSRETRPGLQVFGARDITRETVKNHENPVDLSDFKEAWFENADKTTDSMHSKDMLTETKFGDTSFIDEISPFGKSAYEHHLETLKKEMAKLPHDDPRKAAVGDLLQSMDKFLGDSSRSDMSLRAQLESLHPTDLRCFNDVLLGCTKALQDPPDPAALNHALKQMSAWQEYSRWYNPKGKEKEFAIFGALYTMCAVAGIIFPPALVFFAVLAFTLAATQGVISYERKIQSDQRQGVIDKLTTLNDKVQSQSQQGIEMTPTSQRNQNASSTKDVKAAIGALVEEQKGEEESKEEGVISNKKSFS